MQSRLERGVNPLTQALTWEFQKAGSKDGIQPKMQGASRECPEFQAEGSL